MGKNRRILIRFDDICPTMDYQKWNKAMELLDEYNVKPLIGVIPECLDNEMLFEPEHDDFWTDIAFWQKKGYVIAMHGLHHIYTEKKRGLVNNANMSEFVGLPYETQFHMIAEGKRIFDEHGIKTDVFFAPAHSYDRNTIRALKANGFKYMSDGKSKKPMVRYGIICIPARNGGWTKNLKRGGITAKSRIIIFGMNKTKALMC